MGAGAQRETHKPWAGVGKRNLTLYFVFCSCDSVSLKSSAGSYRFKALAAAKEAVAAAETEDDPPKQRRLAIEICKRKNNISKHNNVDELPAEIHIRQAAGLSARGSSRWATPRAWSVPPTGSHSFVDVVHGEKAVVDPVVRVPIPPLQPTQENHDYSRGALRADTFSAPSCSEELATKASMTTLAILLQLMRLLMILLEPVVVLKLVRILVLELILVHVLVREEVLDPRQGRMTRRLEPSTDD